MNHTFHFRRFSILSLVLVSGCGGASGSLNNSSSNPDSPVVAVQSNLSQTNNQADQTEGSYNLMAACTSSVRSTCSASADTINWGGCTIASGALAFTGTWNETFSGSAAASCTIPVALSNSVLRTSSNTVATVQSGALAGFNISLDTNGGTAYDGTTISSAGITVSNSAGGVRTITINGLHESLRGSGGFQWFDHYLTSTGGLTVSGSRSALPRVMNGTATLYHNLAKYTAASTYNAVTWTTVGSTCHYPTSGSISTTLTGSYTGTTTLTFSSTCGQATYTDTTGTTTNITLNL